MKINFKTVLGGGILLALGANTIVNTVSRINRNKMDDLNYREEILRKKEERLAKKEAKDKKKQIAIATEEA